MGTPGTAVNYPDDDYYLSFTTVGGRPLRVMPDGTTQIIPGINLEDAPKVNLFEEKNEVDETTRKVDPATIVRLSRQFDADESMRSRERSKTTPVKKATETGDDPQRLRVASAATSPQPKPKPSDD